MTPLTVTCLFVNGEYPYTSEYVTRLYAMVTRWIDRPFRFVCLTDRQSLFQWPIETIQIDKLPGFAPWTKLELFNQIRGWSGRMLYLDLDSLIVASLAPIVDVPADFAITADPPLKHKARPRDSFGRQIVRRFNSSVMVWDGGTQTDLYTKWNPKVAERLSGDQDFIAERLPGAHTLPREWFPRLSELHGRPPGAPAKVVLVKVPKNHLAAEQWPWFNEIWRAA